jgi:acetyl esterase/lipase
MRIRRAAAVTVNPHAEVLEVPGPSGMIPLRVIRPGGEIRAVQISLHSGGWCLGSPAANDVTNTAMAELAGVASVAVGYRLAPEHPFPAAIEDVEAATLWLCAHAKATFGCERLLVTGSSAGAHLGALLAVRLRDSHPSALRLVAAMGLAYGCYDISGTPSLLNMPDDSLVVTRGTHQQYLAYAFPATDQEARRAPGISPLYCDLRDLPPALFTAAALDPLLDDTLFMAARWEVAGNRTQLDLWPNCAHGFDANEPITGRRYIDRLCAWYGACLDDGRYNKGGSKAV